MKWLPLISHSFAQTTSADPVSLFVQYGIAGLVIVALLMGLLWAKPAVDGIIKRAERAEQQRDELLKVYEEKMLPALTENIAINREMKPVLVDIVRTAEQMRAQLALQGARPRGVPKP